MSKPRGKATNRQPASSPPKRALSPSQAATAADPKTPSKRARVDNFGVISPDKIVPKTPVVADERAGSEPTFSDEEEPVVVPSQVSPDFSDEEGYGEGTNETSAPSFSASTIKDAPRSSQGRMDISHLLDTEAVESNSGDPDEPGPEEDDGGSFVHMDVEAEVPPGNATGDIGVIARLLASNPELLRQFKEVVTKSCAGAAGRDVQSDAGHLDEAGITVEGPSSPVDNTAPACAAVHADAGTGAAAVAGSGVNASVSVSGATTSPAITVVSGQPQAVLGPGFDTDAVFDGVKSCLNAALWPPGLRSMYRAIVPPPRVVEYKSMKPDAYVTEADFSVWRGHPAAKSLVQALKFVKNVHYVNICRVPYNELSILDTKNIQYPMRYFTVGQNNAPALFVTLVEVRQSRLLTVHVIPKQDRSSTYDKKSLIAAPFSQELDLMVSTMGSTYESNIVHMPSWLTVEELRGFTFHTRIVPTRAGPVTRSSPAKRGKFNSTPVFSDSNTLQPQLVGGQRVVVVDASATGFDFATPFSELKSQTDMKEEPPAGSVGVVFYTISDRGDWTSIEFNIHAFVMLASAPVQA